MGLYGAIKYSAQDLAQPQGRKKTGTQVGFLGVRVYRPLTRQGGGGHFFLELYRERTKKRCFGLHAASNF